MLNLKKFETFDFNGIKVFGTSYVKKLKDNTIIYVCTARDGNIIHKVQNVDYNQCINDLKELYFIRKYIEEIYSIPAFN
jgi:hypothetical protein